MRYTALALALGAVTSLSSVAHASCVDDLVRGLDTSYYCQGRNPQTGATIYWPVPQYRDISVTTLHGGARYTGVAKMRIRGNQAGYAAKAHGQYYRSNQARWVCRQGVSCAGDEVRYQPFWSSDRTMLELRVKENKQELEFYWETDSGGTTQTVNNLRCGPGNTVIGDVGWYSDTLIIAFPSNTSHQECTLTL